jgi:hypothetical protein
MHSPQFTPSRVKIGSNLSTPKRFETRESSSSSIDSADAMRVMPTLHLITKVQWLRVLKKLCLVLRITEMRYRLEVTYNAATWDDFINRGRGLSLADGLNESQKQNENDKPQDENIASSGTILNTEQYEQMLVCGSNCRRHFNRFQSMSAFLGLEAASIPDADAVEAEGEKEGERGVDVDLVGRPRCSGSVSEDAFISYLSTFNVFSEKEKGLNSEKDDVITARNTGDENSSLQRVESASSRNSRKLSIYKFDFLKYDRTNSNNNEEEEEEEVRSIKAATATASLHRNKSVDFTSAKSSTLDLKKCRSVYSLSSSSPAKPAAPNTDADSAETHTHTHCNSSSSRTHQLNCIDSSSALTEVSRMGVLSDAQSAPTTEPADTYADRNTYILTGHDAYTDNETETEAETRSFNPFRTTSMDRERERESADVSVDQELEYCAVRTPSMGVTFRDIFPLSESERSTKTYAHLPNASSSSAYHDLNSVGFSSTDTEDGVSSPHDEIKLTLDGSTGHHRTFNSRLSNERSATENNAVVGEVARVKTKKEIGREKRKSRRQSLKHMNDKMYRFMNEAVNKKANEELSELIAIELNKVVALDKVLQKGRVAGRGGERSRSLPELRNRTLPGPAIPPLPLSTVRFREISTCSANDAETLDLKIAPMPKGSYSCASTVSLGRAGSSSRSGRAGLTSHSNGCTLLPSESSCLHPHPTERASTMKKDPRKQALLFVPTPASASHHLPLVTTETKRIDLRSKARSGKGLDSPYATGAITAVSAARGLEVSPLRLSRHGSRRSSVSSLSQAQADDSRILTGADTGRRRSLSPAKRPLPRISKVSESRSRIEKNRKNEESDNVLRGTRRRSTGTDFTQGPGLATSKARQDIHKVKIKRDVDKEKDEDMPRSVLLAALKVGIPSRLWSLMPSSALKGDTVDDGRGRGRERSTSKSSVKHRGYREGSEEEASTCVSTSCVNTARSHFASPGPIPGPGHGLSNIPEEGKVKRLQDDLQRQYDEDVIKHFLELTEEISY